MLIAMYGFGSTPSGMVGLAKKTLRIMTNKIMTQMAAKDLKMDKKETLANALSNKNETNKIA